MVRSCEGEQGGRWHHAVQYDDDRQEICPVCETMTQLWKVTKKVGAAETERKMRRKRAQVAEAALQQYQLDITRRLRR